MDSKSIFYSKNVSIHVYLPTYMWNGMSTEVPEAFTKYNLTTYLWSLAKFEQDNENFFVHTYNKLNFHSI